ncbi:MAG: MGMT family protein [Methanomassiliicoccales archaeon]|nr:MGMT family protein [Methanomassiliicoccales archaeon]
MGKEEQRGGAKSESMTSYARFSEVLGLFVNLTMRGKKVVSVRLSNEPPSGPYSEDHPYLTRIINHIATGKDGMRDIPLDLEVTPFAREVLEQLRNVPPGEVVTYGEIARRLGKPNASRAVGSACAKNPVTIIVPCHRIVPKSGGVGNYTSDGGSKVKVKLLKQEGALSKVK